MVSPLGHRFLIVFPNFQGLGGHPPIFRHTQITFLVLYRFISNQYPIYIPLSHSISHYIYITQIKIEKYFQDGKKKFPAFPWFHHFWDISVPSSSDSRKQRTVSSCPFLGATVPWNTAGRVPPNMAIGVKWWSTTGFNATGHIFRQSCLFSLYSVLLWSIKMGGLSNHVQPAVLCQKVMQWCSDVSLGPLKLQQLLESMRYGIQYMVWT